jgi:hypothetical protein
LDHSYILLFFKIEISLYLSQEKFDSCDNYQLCKITIFIIDFIGAKMNVFEAEIKERDGDIII